MRRIRDRRPAGLFRAGELPRLMTMIAMLCVLAMMIRRARDRDTWRFLTGEPANLVQGAAEPSPPHKPRVRSRQASHSADSIVVKAPEGISFEVPSPIRITVKGIDKETVGQVAADIRKLRKPEPYKGKGVRYAGEVVQRKAGKAAK